MLDRFWNKVDATGDCWEWTGGTNDAGYGLIRLEGRRNVTHRVSWRWLVGPIPDGLTLDHLCRNRRCVNPDHLEAVAMGTNILRGYGPTAKNARKRQCNLGHALNGENLIIHPDGRRDCRRCRLASQRRRRAAAR